MTMAIEESKGDLLERIQNLEDDGLQERRAALEALGEPDETELEAEETPDTTELLEADQVKRSVLKEDAETADSIRLYLREIGRVPLLTAADEVSLAQRLERGIESTGKLEALRNGSSSQREKLEHV